MDHRSHAGRHGRGILAVALLLGVLGIAPLGAQAPAPAGVRRPAAAAWRVAPMPETPTRTAAAPRRALTRRYVLGSALAGAALAAVALGPSLYEAEIGAPLAYGLPAAGGALLGALAGYGLARARR